MNTAIELGSKWVTDFGVTITVTELVDKQSKIIVFYSEELSNAKRSFGKAGFLSRFTKL
jgi:hypothetical protein